MKKKYAVCPCEIVSLNDRDIHYISADKLMKLYGVDPRECVIVREHEPLPKGLIVLLPSIKGNYKLPDDKK